VRLHSECLTGDVFHSLRCDCGEQLESALEMIEAEGSGVLLYLSQEGRGIGLLNKAARLQAPGGGPRHRRGEPEARLPADLRDYGIGAQILVDLGLTSIRILTNNPKKISGLAGHGLSVTDQIPIVQQPNPHNQAYLRAKRDKLGHILHHQGLALDDEMLHDELVPRRACRRTERACRRPLRLGCALRRALLRGARRRTRAGRARRARGGGHHRCRQLRGSGRLRAAC